MRLTAIALLVSGILLACDGDTVVSVANAEQDSVDSSANSEQSSVDSGANSGSADLMSSGTVTFTIKNQTTVSLSLPGGMAGRWLEIGLSGYSMWPANSVTDNALCDADPQELGELPPPGGEIPVNGEHIFEWRANAFMGAAPIPGMSEEYMCANTGRVPLGEQQFLICARQAGVACSAPDFDPFPPQMICTSLMAQVAAGQTSAEFVFDSDLFPTENCSQGEEIPN